MRRANENLSEPTYKAMSALFLASNPTFFEDTIQASNGSKYDT